MSQAAESPQIHDGESIANQLPHDNYKYVKSALKCNREGTLVPPG